MIQIVKFIVLSELSSRLDLEFELFLPLFEAFPRLFVFPLALFLTSSSLPIAGRDLVLLGGPLFALAAENVAFTFS